MTISWILKEVEGGNDGVAQIRSDAPNGVKLGDLSDGTPIRIPDLAQMTIAERKQYLSGSWIQCLTSDKVLFFRNPSGKSENWIENANTREFGAEPGTARYHIVSPMGEFDITVTRIK